jgi:hypothetical protein
MNLAQNPQYVANPLWIPRSGSWAPQDGEPSMLRWELRVGARRRRGALWRARARAQAWLVAPLRPDERGWRPAAAALRRRAPNLKFTGLTQTLRQI